MKALYSFLGIALTFAALVPYIISILQEKTRPHVFSWCIWTITTFLVFLAQLHDGGGLGAWVIGVSASIALCIAVLGYSKRGNIIITRTDWTFFLSALSSVPFWLLTRDPMWAVIVLTITDLLGFGPTVRKTWGDPWSEPLMFFALYSTCNILAIMALEHYSVTTVLFPAAIALACMSMSALLIWRRLQLARDKQPAL